MTKKQTSYSWDKYVDEAKAEDFVLKTADGEIRITNPTGARVMRVSQGMRANDLDLILLGLTGDAYKEVSALLAQVGHKALPRLIEDIQEHFDMYEEIELVGPGGGTVKASKPTELRALFNMGYKPVGE